MPLVVCAVVVPALLRLLILLLLIVAAPVTAVTLIPKTAPAKMLVEAVGQFRLFATPGLPILLLVMVGIPFVTCIPVIAGEKETDEPLAVIEPIVVLFIVTF